MVYTPIILCAPYLHCLGIGEHFKHDSSHKVWSHTFGNNMHSLLFLLLFLACTWLACPIASPDPL